MCHYCALLRFALFVRISQTRWFLYQRRHKLYRRRRPHLQTEYLRVDPGGTLDHRSFRCRPAQKVKEINVVIPLKVFLPPPLKITKSTP